MQVFLPKPAEQQEQIQCLEGRQKVLVMKNRSHLIVAKMSERVHTLANKHGIHRRKHQVSLQEAQQLKRGIQYLHERMKAQLEGELSNNDIVNNQLKKTNLHVSQVETDLKAKLRDLERTMMSKYQSSLAALITRIA